MGDFVDRFSKIPLSQRLLILIVIMTVVGIGFYVLLYQPLEDEIDAVTQALPTLVSKHDELKDRIKNQDDYRREIAKEENENEKMQKELPKKAELPEVLQTIYDKGKVNKVQILRFEPLDEEPESLFVRIPIEIELLGTYMQITDFFYALENMNRIINVENIVLEKDKGKSELLKATCLATTFRYSGDVVKKKEKRKRR